MKLVIKTYTPENGLEETVTEIAEKTEIIEIDVALGVVQEPGVIKTSLTVRSRCIGSQLKP